MAERAHEIPAKYGDVLELFHPRMRSYGRRIEAALPGTITLVAAIAFLAYKTPRLAVPGAGAYHLFFRGSKPVFGA